MPFLEQLVLQVALVAGSKHLVAAAAAEDHPELPDTRPGPLPERTEAGSWS